MRTHTSLVLTLLAAPALIAQAPAAPATLGQRLAAERPEIKKLNDAFDYAQAQARAEALIPAAKPAFDKSSVNNLHLSTRTYADLCQVYFLAFQAADNNGQWEKGLEYLNKALDTAKENVASGKEGLTEQRDYWKKKADAYQELMNKNADAIRLLKAKTKLEDYEEGTMAQVKGWEKEKADGEKWSQFFQYDLDLATRNVDDFQKFVDLQAKKIKDQQADIDTYKGHPGDKDKWAEAVASSKAYLDSFAEKADRIAFLHRLKVLAPDNHKVQNALDVALGRAVPEKAAPAKKKR
ncbi:hypothetical protein METEAL_13640 [Mesoterricola silvestris]|uniref:Uncharacterized protein n=2 Tax=Mesoterricola silvestris TaxID=2927979 RepID=A0AA48GMF5_9BACT|nr:hypothetical protein METEAL_13640 [Mesoterricola silvestris]